MKPPAPPVAANEWLYGCPTMISCGVAGWVMLSGWIVIGVLRVWLSRVAEADAVAGVAEVKVDEATPD